MEKVIFAGFDTEQKAFEGDHALHELHRDGTITLYNDAVVVKEPNGHVAVREQPDNGPVGTLGGMATGSLIGLIGGPVGAAVGFGAGTIMGAAFDLARYGINRDYVEDVGARLEPGKAAVIAEIDEGWELPLDTRVEALGSRVVRRTRTEIADAYLEEDIAASQKELAALEAEKLAETKASQTEKSRRQTERLQTKIDEARWNLRAKEEELKGKLEAVQKEGAQKIAMLEAQKATAAADSHALLERRLTEVRVDYERRMQRLRDFIDRRKKAHAAPAA